MFYIVFRLDGNSLEKRYCANSFDFLYPIIILYGNARKTFEEAVTVSNKQFALMVIDDRW